MPWLGEKKLKLIWLGAALSIGDWCTQVGIDLNEIGVPGELSWERAPG